MSEITVPKGRHISPGPLSSIKALKGLWISVSNCTKCDAVGAREDVHPVNPCPCCGSKLSEKVGRWVIETKPILFGLFRIKDKAYWEVKNK